MYSHLHIIFRFENAGQQFGFSHSVTTQFPRMRFDEIDVKIRYTYEAQFLYLTDYKE
jgi:hypothetical protein